VKINFKIQQILSPVDFEKLKTNLRKEEQSRIARFFKSDKDQEVASDPSGFYWIERPEINTGQPVEPGDVVQIAYEGSFLNGRFLERSTTDFEFIYGTPDQLLKGLNYVIGTLKTGQTSKILLPSRLAFGEDGSSNGIVPPCTPLIYKIKIIDVKKPK
jgi:FKBP-type peptidyl-prolyl cis-trans isomerase